jgi:hypothetical protein
MRTEGEMVRADSSLLIIVYFGGGGGAVRLSHFADKELANNVRMWRL